MASEPKPITQLAGGTSSLKAEVTPDLSASESASAPQETTERPPTYGNARCRCGHLSDRHACDYETCDDSCFNCECEAFAWDGTPIPSPASIPALGPANVAPAPAPREALEHAARLLAKSLPDEVLESMREEWGHTNVAVIQHWRDAVLAALRASEDTTPALSLQEIQNELARRQMEATRLGMLERAAECDAILAWLIVEAALRAAEAS